MVPEIVALDRIKGVVDQIKSHGRRNKHGVPAPDIGFAAQNTGLADKETVLADDLELFRTDPEVGFCMIGKVHGHVMEAQDRIFCTFAGVPDSETFPDAFFIEFPDDLKIKSHRPGALKNDCHMIFFSLDAEDAERCFLDQLRLGTPETGFSERA